MDDAVVNREGEWCSKYDCKGTIEWRRDVMELVIIVKIKKTNI
jgi:hypothetical protein